MLFLSRIEHDRSEWKTWPRSKEGFPWTRQRIETRLVPVFQRLTLQNRSAESRRHSFTRIFAGDTQHCSKPEY